MEKKELDHSTKLRLKSIQDNLERIQGVVDFIVGMYNNILDYSCRLDNRDILTRVMATRPVELGTVKLSDDDIVKAVLEVVTGVTAQILNHNRVANPISYGMDTKNIPF